MPIASFPEIAPHLENNEGALVALFDELDDDKLLDRVAFKQALRRSVAVAAARRAFWPKTEAVGFCGADCRQPAPMRGGIKFRARDAQRDAKSDRR